MRKPFSTYIQLSVSILIMVTSLSACRTGKRGIRAGDSPVQLKAYIGGDLTQEKLQEFDLTFEMSECVTPTQGSVVQEAQNQKNAQQIVVTFSAPGFRLGQDNCILKAKTLKPNSNITLLSKDSGEGVLYLARGFKISQEVDGSLKAVVPTQRNFTIIRDNLQNLFTLLVPVTFPKEDMRQPMTAHLACVPHLSETGIFRRTSGTSGEFSFTIDALTDSDYQCASVSVDVAGQVEVYRAQYTESQSFTAQKQKNHKLSAIELINLKPENGDLQVGTQDPTKPCLEYDSVNSKCLKYAE